jgi:DNA-binding protein HU-beta
MLPDHALSRVDLSQANLQDAVLIGADLSDTNLSGANLRSANLSSVDLRTASGLTQEQINQAVTDRDTLLPSLLASPEDTAAISSNLISNGVEVPSGPVDIVTTKRIIEKVSGQTGLTTHESQNFLDAFKEIVTDSLKNGEQVQITGFGKFYVQKRDARQGINPQTKQRINIPASKVPKFTAGSTLKKNVSS